jgi:hypothetical protein
VQVGVLTAVGDVRKRICGAPIDRTVDGLGIRIDQQLGRIEPRALLRSVRPVDPVAVSLTRADLGDIDMPQERGAVLDVNAPFVAVLIEQAQLDSLGVL